MWVLNETPYVVIWFKIIFALFAWNSKGREILSKPPFEATTYLNPYVEIFFALCSDYMCLILMKEFFSPLEVITHVESSCKNHCHSKSSIRILGRKPLLSRITIKAMVQSDPNK